MLEWTGERFLPWRKDPALAYEHLHRYMYAAQFVTGKSVLDLASGEGYGSHTLAQTAARVVGVDIDGAAVEHSRQRYVRNNLQFVSGSVTQVPLAENNTFDVIVCFEAIEHIEDQDRLLSEVHRLLKPDGIFIVSTPNKTVYDGAIQHENEFHVKELDFEEFHTLLGKHFKHQAFLGQRIFAESNLWPIAKAKNEGFKEFLVERGESEFESIEMTGKIPMYFVAVVSNVPIPNDLPTSIFVDNANELMNAKDREIRELLQSKESLEEALRWNTDQIASRDKSIGWFEGEVASLKSEIEANKVWHEHEMRQLGERITNLNETIAYLNETVIVSLRATIASQEEGLTWRAGQVESLELERDRLVEIVQTTTTELGRASEQLNAIHASSGWKFVLRLRHYRQLLHRLIHFGR